MIANPTLYEINTVLWLQELSDKYSKRITLGTVPSREWDKIKKYKFDYVWLMGVWKRSVAGRKIAQQATEMFGAYNEALPGWSDDDIAGSPYSIQAYDPDPAVGDWDALEKARQQLDRRGAGLILDLIPNHTGIDHPWVKKNPSNYLQGTEANAHEHPELFFPVTTAADTRFFAKGRDPYFPPWNDTLQLNYFSASYRGAIKRLVRKLSDFCDGFRCDMAMLGLNEVFSRTWAGIVPAGAHPTEFWEEIIGSSPKLLWIAEAYWNTEWKLQQLGFSATYDKVFYDRVRWKSATDINAHLRADGAFQARLVRFLENHDETRALAAFGPERLRAALVLLFSVPGCKLFHQGQLEGRTVRIPVQLVRAAGGLGDRQIEALYSEVFALFRKPVFRDGDWTLLEATDVGDGTAQHLVSCLHTFNKETALIVVNLSSGWAQGRIRFQPPEVDKVTRKRGGAQPKSPETSYLLVDEITGERFVRDRSETESLGLNVLLEPHQAHVFNVKRS